jgi:elongator complex protein 3
MDQAQIITGEAGLDRIAVIAALGTRGYYQRLGYTLDGTYMTKSLLIRD